MTDEESLQLKAKTVVELSDLRQERTNLRAKADVFLNEILRAKAVWSYSNRAISSQTIRVRRPRTTGLLLMIYWD